MAKLRLGVLASGRGSNLQAIIDEIESGRLNAAVEILIVDNPRAYAVERAKRHSIEYCVISPDDFQARVLFFAEVASRLNDKGIDLVVLAGFMHLVKKPLTETYRNRIMNIHPALLPSFPGLHSQKQALDYGVKLSGCTVHFVDDGMDTGPVIIQAAVPVYPDDTEDELSGRILKMEHKIYPEAIRLYSEGRLKVNGRRVSVEGCGIREEHIVNPPLAG